MTKNSQNKFNATGYFLAFLLILSMGGIVLLLMERNTEQDVQKSLERTNVEKKEEVKRLHRDIKQLHETLNEERKIGKPPAPERMTEVFGKGPAPASSPQEAGPGAQRLEKKVLKKEAKGAGPPPSQFLNCVALEDRIQSFFSYLDDKGYPFEKGSAAYFFNVRDRLARRLPIAGGRLTPEEVLDNSFHFYRSLSKKDIRLIKEVMEHEKDAMEQVISFFYEHSTRCRDRKPFLPPLAIQYEYAHFFLHSLAGRSYLFRVGGNMRTLLLYYSTMIVHEANRQEINRYGLDIRPYLEKTEAELKNTRGLYNVDKYLDAIRRARQSYRFAPPV